MLFQEGMTIDRFELLTLLGKGSMGEVYKARDTRLNRIVALKVVNPGMLKKATVLARFQQEMQVLAKMSHPNIVKVYTYGQATNVFYFVQEYVEGETLEAQLQRRGPLPPEEVAELARTVADAFTHFHPMGVIHRDLKPANLMVDKDGVLKIMDFGLVRQEEETRLTETGGIVGTLAYIAPDVLEGNEPTPLTDVYSLGCVLYELLTGHMVLDRRSFLQVGFKELRAKLRELELLPKGLDPRLDAVVRLCLCADPGDRLQGGEEILHVLETGERLPPPAPRARRAPTARMPQQGAAPGGAVGAQARRAVTERFTSLVGAEGSPRRRAVVPSVVVLALLAALALLARSRPRGPGDCFGGFRVRPGLISADLSWTGARPHTVSWRLRGDGRDRVEQVGQARERHELVLPDLTPGARYDLELRSDGGESLTTSFQTDRLALVGAPVVARASGAGGARTVTVTVRLNHAAPAELDLEGVRAGPQKRPAARTHAFVLDLAGATGVGVADLALPAVVRAGGRELWRGRVGLGPRVVAETLRLESLRGRLSQRPRSRFRSVSDDAWPFAPAAGPLTRGDRAYLADAAGFVYALAPEARAGRVLRWVLRLPDAPGGVRPRPACLLAREGGHLLVLAADGARLVAWHVDARGREPEWERRTGGERDLPPDRLLELAAAPEWVRMREGQQEWEKALADGPAATNPLVPFEPLPDERVLAWHAEREEFVCLDPFRGRVAWRVRAGRLEDAARPVVAGDEVLLLTRHRDDQQETLRVVDRGSGEVRVDLPLGTGAGSLRPCSPCAAPGGAVYAASGSALYKVVGGVTAWRAPRRGYGLGRPLLQDGLLVMVEAAPLDRARLGELPPVLRDNPSALAEAWRVSLVELPVGDRPPSEGRRARLDDLAVPTVLRSDLLEPLAAGGSYLLGYGNELLTFDRSTFERTAADPLRGRMAERPLVADGRALFACLGGSVYLMEAK